MERKNSILFPIQRLRDFRQQIATVLADDVEPFEFRVNKAATLPERKAKIESIGGAMDRALEAADSDSRNMIDDSNAMLLSHDQPTVFFAEIEDGRVLSFRPSGPTAVEVRA